LGGRVDGVKAEGDVAFEVTPDCVQRKAEPLASLLVLGPVVVMSGISRAGSVGLERVGTAVHEEMEVIRHHVGGRFETKITHSHLPEGRRMGSVLHVRGEIIRAFCNVDRLVAVMN
jgi:hypothetical protein